MMTERVRAAAALRPDAGGWWFDGAGAPDGSRGRGGRAGRSDPVPGFVQTVTRTGGSTRRVVDGTGQMEGTSRAGLGQQSGEERRAEVERSAGTDPQRFAATDRGGRGRRG